MKSLQTASVVGGFPFMLIMLLMVYCLFKSIYGEPKGLGHDSTVPVQKSKSA
ncbi:MAG TPA: BCCT family transporter [Bacillota bacterium]|nr:BCCT family transporter [Bacillota bacterium]